MENSQYWRADVDQTTVYTEHDVHTETDLCLHTIRLSVLHFLATGIAWSLKVNKHNAKTKSDDTILWQLHFQIWIEIFNEIPFSSGNFQTIAYL